jgi:hypothetical protein
MKERNKSDTAHIGLGTSCVPTSAIYSIVGFVNNLSEALRRPRILSILIAILVALACSRVPAQKKIVEAYCNAFNSGNISALMALCSPDIRTEFVGMGPALSGKEELSGKAEYDTTLKAKITLTIVRSKRDSVICTGQETNEWHTQAGLPPNDYSKVTFIIKDNNTITELRFELSDSSVERINEVMQELIPWAMENRPDEYARIVSDETPFFSPAKARDALYILQEWHRIRRF